MYVSKKTFIEKTWNYLLEQKQIIKGFREIQIQINKMKSQQKKILRRQKFNKYNTLKYKPIICNPIASQEKEIL